MTVSLVAIPSSSPAESLLVIFRLLTLLRLTFVLIPGERNPSLFRGVRHCLDLVGSPGKDVELLVLRIAEELAVDFERNERGEAAMVGEGVRR